MAQQPWFRDWFNSPYYHQLYFERNEMEAKAFIDRLLQLLKPAPGSRMLDIACGKGRHAQAIAEKGYDVTGIDISPAMIEEANKLECSNLHFYVHDMRLPFRINYFQFVYNFFTSFGYFNTLREHQDAIRTMSAALKPGGCLVIDYLNVHYIEEHLVHKDKKEVNDINFFITRWMDEDYFFKKIEIEDPTLEAPLVYTEKVSKFSLGDFNDMLSYQGIQIQEVYGDYQLGGYDLRKSPRLIMVGRKMEKGLTVTGGQA
jgi:SAM-dependent methyltransferase